MYEIDRENLWKKYRLDKQESQFNTGIEAKVIPFKTKRNEGAFQDSVSIFSMMSRNISGESYIENLEKEELITRIVSNVDTSYKTELKTFIEKVFFDGSTLNVFHPKIFNYREVTDTYVKDISSFIYNALYSNDLKDLGRSVYNYESTTIIEKMILESMPKRIESSSIKTDGSFCIISSIKELFREDFEYICSDPKFFIENVEMLVQYYLVFLCIQTSLKLKNSFDSEDDNIVPVYYFVDWEQVSKSRTGYVQGWKMVSKKSIDLFAYTNMLEVLNTTTIKSNYSFVNIKEKLNEMDYEDLKKFEETINDFVAESETYLGLSSYPQLHSFKYPFNGDKSIVKLISMLVAARSTGKKTAYSKYEDTLKDVVKHRFLKPRGNIGSTLNIKEEWLIFLTRLCIKDNEKIRLNILWIELEKRGVYFDKFSKSKIVEYYEKINLLEKKSDSGDAQYVRIL